MSSRHDARRFNGRPQAVMHLSSSECPVGAIGASVWNVTPPPKVPHLITATDPATGSMQTFMMEEASTSEEAAESIRNALARSHPEWIVAAVPNPAKPVGIVAPSDGPLSMVHYVTCPSFEGRDDLELNPRSEPMTIQDAQTWVNQEDAAVCLRCAPPVSEQAGRRSRYA